MTNLLFFVGYAALVVAGFLFHPALGVAAFGGVCIWVGWVNAPDGGE